MLPDDLKDYYARERFDYVWAIGCVVAGAVAVYIVAVLVLALG